MTDLTERALEDAIAEARALCAERGGRMSFDPTHIVYRPSDLDDPRNVVKFLRIKKRMREAVDARSRKTWADATLKDWARKPWARGHD